MRDLAALPKAEMHLHLLGAMRESTLVESAAEAGREAPDPRAFTTFAEFQKVFQAAFAATRTSLENLLRLVREVVADAAANGAVWVQPHFDPHVYPAFGSPEDVMEAVLAERRAAGNVYGVTLDVCLTSNVRLGVVADPADHPLPALLAAGVPCSLGADDPLMFGASLLDEYRTAHTALGLDDGRLAELARTSVVSSGAPESLKAAAVAGIDEWLASDVC